MTVFMLAAAYPVGLTGGAPETRSVTQIDWNPVPHLGPIPINWYGLGWVAAYAVGLLLVRRGARRTALRTVDVEGVAMWALLGAIIGARLYYIAQNEPAAYLDRPWCIVAVWQGGLGYFGGLSGAIAAAYLYARRHRLSFPRLADLFAPAIPVAAAIGRIPCFLDGMDYGTPGGLPWGIVYLNPKSYAPLAAFRVIPIRCTSSSGIW